MVNRNRSQSMTFNGHRTENDERRQKETMTELKNVLTSIKYDWPQCLKEDANPIDMAISLLDDTSVGLAHKKHEFERLSQDTSQALRHFVSENHEIFNNSIGSYHLLLSTLQDSQEDSAEIKEMLETSSKAIQDRSDVLNELDQNSIRYSEMIEILDAMDDLNNTPAKVEQLIIDKKIHQVYDVIANSYNVAEQYNLWSLPAMNSIQSYLEVQSNNLYDMIVDELQNEIYLKNSTIIEGSVDNTQDRSFSWQNILQSSNPQLSSFKTLITQSNNLEQYIYNSANLDIFEIADFFSEDATKFVTSQLPKLHAHNNNSNGTEIDYSILLESNLNTSSQSYHYIYMLLTTASKLNRLHQVLEVLVGTNQQELHGLINRTTEESKLKNIIQLNKLSKIQNFDHTDTFDMIGGNTFNDASVVVLEDLFGSIFIKFLTVLQKHKVVSIIVNIIESSQSLPGTSSSIESYVKDQGIYDFYSVWNVMKKELQSLMINYTYDDSHLTNNSLEKMQHSDLHDVLLKKELFKFEDVLYSESTKTTEDMKHVLTNMFPGFVLSETGQDKTTSLELSSPYIKNENFNALVEVLVPKNIFNMRIILEFFLIFTAGSQTLFLNFQEEPQEGAPFDSSSLQFFTSFMRTSFLAKLNDSLDHSFQEFVEDKGAASNTLVTQNAGRVAAGSSSQQFSSGLKSALVSIDYIQSGPQTFANLSSGNTHSAAKIYQNALDFKRIFVNACSTLNTSLTYRKEISDLVLKFLSKFSQAYNNFYKELLSQGEAMTSYGTVTSSKPALALQKWIGSSALTDMSGFVLQQTAVSEDLEGYVNKETEMMLLHSESNTEIFDMSKDDFLDDESFNQVCYLLLTVSWILSWLPSMKKESNYTIYNDNTDTVRLSTIDKLKHDWSFLENGRSSYSASDETQHVYLALNSSKINEFNDIMHNFESIRDKTLLALRYDLRAKAIYFLGKSFKGTDWLPTTEPGDSDQYIGQYNKEVFSVDNKLNNVLKDIERDSVFVGLPNFINKLLLQGSALLHKINNNGIKKVLLNIFTLQQMLKSIMKQPEKIDFTTSSRYFELFTLKEQQFLSEVKKNELGFTRAEYINLARLVYSEKLADGGGSAFNRSKYNDLVKKIGELT